MSATPVFNLVEPTFSAQLTEDDGKVAVRLAGHADVVAQPHLEGLFKTLHKSAQSAKADSVRVDIRELAFMSSSCFKQVVLWIQRIVTAQGEHRYQVVFQSAAAQAWQARALKTLTHFAGGVMRVEQT